jgi:hypothetical protein
LFSEGTRDLIVNLYKEKRFDKIESFLIRDILLDPHSLENQYLRQINVNSEQFFKNGLEILNKIGADRMLIQSLSSKFDILQN